MLPHIFWNLTYAEYVRLRENHTIKDNILWEHTRQIEARIVNGYFRGKDKKAVQPKDLYKLPQDSVSVKKSKPLPTEKDLERIRSRKLPFLS